MKFVSVTRCGNENDIIEAFVRHHVALFDLILIIDDNSTDGTVQILEALQAEGLPLILFHVAEVDWNPVDLVTELMRRAFNEYDAQWVAPLDVDEFLELPADTGLGDFLPERSELAAQLRWSNFAWTRGLDETERNPVIRMRTRMPPRTDSFKVIIPWNIVQGDPTATVLPGNHAVRAHGRIADLFYRQKMALCHYPIRSVQQFASKVVINALRHKAMPHGPKDAGFQYRKPLEALKTNPGILPRGMEQASRLYALQAGGKMIGEIEDRPLLYRGGPLLHSQYQTRAISNIITLAESLAERVAALEAEIARLKA
jgi:hypothetical protein